mgnify:CR=1 FL=1
MSYNASQESFMKRNDTNNFSKISKAQSISSTDYFSENNDKLFKQTLQLAINNNLMVPSKDKDFFSIDSESIYNHNNILEINNKEKLDWNKLSKIMKIFSKYNY